MYRDDRYICQLRIPCGLKRRSQHDYVGSRGVAIQLGIDPLELSEFLLEGAYVEWVRETAPPFVCHLIIGKYEGDWYTVVMSLPGMLECSERLLCTVTTHALH